MHLADMDTQAVMAWVAAYERTWRDQDVAGLDRIFTPDAVYLHSPYSEPLVGLEVIGEDWPDPTPFTMRAEPVAVDARRAVVRVLVRYTGEQPQEYLDLWVLDFAADGRVRRFEEWAYWPDKTWSVSQQRG